MTPLKLRLVQKRYFALTPLLLLLLLAFTPQTAQATDGTNGKIDIGLTSVVENTLLNVRFHQLDVSCDYNATWTDGTTTWYYEFTTGADQTEQSIPIRIVKGAGGNTFTIQLLKKTAGTVIDTHSLFVSPYSDFLDEDQYIDLGIPIMVIVIFAGIIVGLIAAFKLKG